jgi:3-dehydroquinate synthase
MRTIKVELEEQQSRSYPIYIERGCLDELGPGLSRLGLKSKCVLVTNPRVGSLYGKRISKSLEGAGFDILTVEVRDGEEYKTLEEASKVYDHLIEARMERTTPIVALGGGVIGDITGFVAATYLRGVPYVQVPTTLLAQVDSSVGGKTAVNHPRGKNLIGAFFQPKAVFIDPDVLKTLDIRELRAGLAEVVKYGIIRDQGFFRFLEDNSQALLDLEDSLVSAIERSCEIKAQVVAEDETEKGLRSILNFGHTFGHAIEAVTGFGRYKHGEAISMGMIMAASFSLKLGLCDGAVVSRIANILETLGLPVEAPELAPEAIIEAMLVDKKVLSGRMRFVLVRDIGNVVVKEIPDEEVTAFLRKEAC